MIETFDVEAWLDDRNIAYTASGKNVSANWIGLNCMFCSDPSNHLGINRNNKRYSCWRCGAKGSIVKLIMRHDRIPYDQVQKVLFQYQDLSVTPTVKHLYPTTVDDLDFPEGCMADLPTAHYKWLMSRDFSPQFIQREYHVRALTLDDYWPWRLVVPLYYHYQLVTFIGADVTGEADVPYKNYPALKSVIDAKHTLYNIDRVGHTALVVEGVTDVWRIGDGAVATNGTKWTKAQVSQLMGLKAVFVMYDAEPEAQQQAHRLAAALTSGVNKVEVLELSEGDPAELPSDTVKALRREIFGR